MLRLLPALGAALLLGACAAIPDATEKALSALDPLTADPAGFVLFLDLPPGIGIEEGSVTLGLSAEREDTGARFSHLYILDETSAGQTAPLAFRVAPGDMERLRADQARSLAWKTEAPHATSGSLSVSAAGCATGAVIPPDATVSVALQTAMDGPALPLLRDQPLARLLGMSGPEVTQHPCDHAIH